MASQTGVLFRVMTFGESHGPAVGCIVDGCPPGITLRSEMIEEFLARRKPGQNAYTTSRKEDDSPEILSGVHNDLTLGTPLAIMVRNTNQKSQDYDDIAKVFRPSHADFTTIAKYGVRAAAGGGRSSARETIGRVAAAAVARAFLQSLYPKLEVVAWVARVASVEANVDASKVTVADVEMSEIRCPDSTAETQMKQVILNAKSAGDTVGGVIRSVARGLPAGLGEPVFDKLEADLAKAMLSLPATKSFEIGSGLQGTYLKGSQHNDAFVTDGSNKKIKTATNNSGGVQGGISNGMPLEIAVGFKPVSTIFQEQNTVDAQGKAVVFKPKQGRHDPCVLPRAVPMVEAMVWLVLADHVLRQMALTQGEPPKA